jgi:phosphoribosylamine--glycine ligase
VVKADGLAAGKGVFVCLTDEEARAGLRAATALGGTVVVEELLEGREVSLFALCDGSRALPLGAATDYKRAGDGDIGPNTGGMGAFSPVELPVDASALVEQIHQPVLDELARRGTPFIGCLFAGVMLTADGPFVLEFNARFGDPEAQALLPRLEGDLLAALSAAAAGKHGEAGLRERNDAAVTVVVAAPTYPERSDFVGAEITGIEEAERDGALVFQGGTAIGGGRLVTNGGRVLSVTAVAETREAARKRAYGAAAKIGFEGAWYRTDIGS